MLALLMRFVGKDTTKLVDKDLINSLIQLSILVINTGGGRTTITQRASNHSSSNVGSFGVRRCVTVEGAGRGGQGVMVCCSGGFWWVGSLVMD